MAERDRHEVGLVAARLLMGALFVVMGYYKIGDIAGVAEWLAEWGLPGGTALAWAVAVVEMGGGIALAIGIWPGPVALLLALYLVPATLWFHRDVDVDAQVTHLIKNTGIIGGLLAIWSCRGGRMRLL